MIIGLDLSYGPFKAADINLFTALLRSVVRTGKGSTECAVDDEGWKPLSLLTSQKPIYGRGPIDSECEAANEGVVRLSAEDCASLRTD
jgi:hypothetical protein